MRLAKRLVHYFGQWYCREVCKSDYRSQTTKILEKGPAFQAVFRALAQVFPATVLDVGAGISAFPHILRESGFLVTATDNIRDYWPEGMFNRHWLVLDDDITKTSLTDRFDFVTAISVLQHIADHRAAVRNMVALLKPGGHLFLASTYNERKYIHDAYWVSGAGYNQDVPYICQQFSRKELDAWGAENGLVLLEQEYWQIFTGEFWTCGERIARPRKVEKDDLHHWSCVLFRKAAA